jgi:myo-inositol 2-dehydrogenase / D-chiro-inositol 1-dehydrogenase
MSHSTITRRGFLARSAGAAAAGLSVPYFFSSSQARAESKNDRLNVASIGVSIYRNVWGQAGPFDGRGTVIGHQAGALENMVACCDVNREHAESFASRYEGRCDVYADYREMLQREDIDAVTIGTPDHWHAAIAIAAMKAGKDVYCEKPLTLTIDEGNLICQVAKETGSVVQVGTQQRSEYDQMFLKAVAIARSGRLGEKLTALSSVGQPDFVANNTSGGPFENAAPPEQLDWDFWLGQAPKVPYCPERCDYNFRWWLEYSGGQVTDWGVHHSDIALWALGGEQEGIATVEGTGDFPVLAASGSSTADCLDGRAKLPCSYNVARDFDCQMTLGNGNAIRLLSGKNELILSGDKGRIRVNRRGLSGKPVEQLNAAEQEWLDEEILRLCKGKKPGNHMANFFECVRDRSLPISDVFTHVSSVNACHMANISMILGRKLTWDSQKGAFVKDDEANRYVKRKQREGFEIRA